MQGITACTCQTGHDLPRRGRNRAAAVLLSLALGACGNDDKPQHEVSVPWGIGGAQLIADLHMHTRYSDGTLDIDDMVRKAYAGGCRVVAITDHSDSQVRSGGEDYFRAIGELRKKYPRHVLIGGLEWNVPPYQGRIHMGVLADTTVERQLIAFKQKFEGPKATITEALGWLRQQTPELTQAALIFNHPGRHGETAPQLISEWTRMRGASPQVIGFEGGPGHQNMKPNGAYANVPTIDRWDPLIATVGGAWDRLLDRGENPRAALANSDYHKADTEPTPCEFSRTVLIVPEPTVGGVLKALHAGSFWATQGRFIDYLLFTVTTPGLQMPASPGEVIRVAKGAPLNVRVAVERYRDAGSHPLTVEIIGNCAQGKPDSLLTHKLERNQSDLQAPLTAAAPGGDGASCYLRARVRGQTAAGEPAVAYSNAIRMRFPAAGK